MARMSISRTVGHAAVTLSLVAAVSSVIISIGWGLEWQWVAICLVGVVTVAVTLVGGAFITAQPHSATGWIFLLCGMCLPVTNLTSVVGEGAFFRGHHVPGREVLLVAGQIPAILGVFLLGTLGILLFPDGRVHGRATRLLAVGCGVELIALLFWALFSTPFSGDERLANPIALPGVAGQIADVLQISILLFTPISALCVASLLRRARREVDFRRRRALRLAGWCAASVPFAFAVCIVVSFAGVRDNSVTLLENSSSLVIGVAAWVGISRYGLLDVRVVLSRAMVYTTLTVLVAALYLGAVAALDALLAGAAPRIVVTAAAVLVVLPLRDRVQRIANRLVYGIQEEPMVAIGRLQTRLDAVRAPDDVLPAAVTTLAEALRLRYVALLLEGETLAEHGARTADPLVRLTLPFVGREVGALVLQPRQPDTVLDTGPGALLTRDLARSRENLVLAREEERRSLRRELHDGLGPTLAAVGLGLESAQHSLGDGDRARATATLAELRRQTALALQDVRRVTYDLRPAILDELGLAEALREQAARFGAAATIIPEVLPPLPAAVEVATYRIAMEALTNARRHAPGSSISISLSVNGRVDLEVIDEGTVRPTGDDAGHVAPARSYRPGVGIASMRERASELGGVCSVEPVQPRGTRVCTVLPLHGTSA